jgi:hypothetical protein
MLVAGERDFTESFIFGEGKDWMDFSLATDGIGLAMLLLADGNVELVSFCIRLDFFENSFLYHFILVISP